MYWENERAEQTLRAVFAAAVASADPRICLAAHLPPRPKGRCVVVGGGKAAAAMAVAVEAAWPDVPLRGAVVTPYGQSLPTKHINVLEAAHPVPDSAGPVAARRMLREVAGLGADDLVLVLISGGASSLLALPAPGLSLSEKQVVGRRLLASGAAIAEMNLVRRQLSAIKGGRLARAAAPAQVVTLAISDVPGDDPLVIGSGLTVPESTSPAKAALAALAVLARYHITPPAAVAAYLGNAARDSAPTADLASDYRLISTPLIMLNAAATAASAAGLTPLILGDALEGEAREMGRVLAGIALSARTHGLPVSPPCLLLSGGEATVTLSAAPGQGGPNREFLLAFALALEAAGLDPRQPGRHIWALAADTDGIDGTPDAAGAWIGPDTLARATAAGCDPLASLLAHDSTTPFAAANTLLCTGATLTNVNDLRAILIA